MLVEQASVPRKEAGLLPAQQSLAPCKELLPRAEGLLPRGEVRFPPVEAPMPRAQPNLPAPIASMPPATAFRSVDDSICYVRTQMSVREQQITGWAALRSRWVARHPCLPQANGRCRVP